MSNMNEICIICGERRGDHVRTAEGPETHPREARGEGVYRVKSGSFGTRGHGLDCDECGGPCSMDHPFDTRVWEFVPAIPDHWMAL